MLEAEPKRLEETQMGATNKRARKATETAQSLSSHPYVRRLMEDEELRANIKSAFEAAKDAYSRMNNGKGPGTALMDDRKLHDDLGQAAEALRDASQQIRGKRKRRTGGIGRLLLVATVGAVLVLVFSEDARRMLLDRLFGAEEEFEYTSTTTAADQEKIPTA
jgi:hypothetical protein